MNRIINKVFETQSRLVSSLRDGDDKPKFSTTVEIDNHGSQRFEYSGTTNVSCRNIFY